MTFAEIQADVYRRCGYAASPAADVITRIKAFINETLQDVFAEPGMDWLLNDQTTLTSVAAQAEYTVGSMVQRIKTFRDTANRRVLRPMSLEEYRQHYPDPVAMPGTPSYYVEMGWAQVFTQPVTPQQLTVISTAAGDTTQTVYLEGLRTGGVFFSTSVALNGTTLVNIGGTDVETITKFYISAVAAGEVRLRDAAVAVISRIVIGHTSPRYRMIALVPTPSAVLTYNLDYERTVNDLVVATDEPALPLSFHRMLASGARAKEYEKQNQLDRMAVARADYVMALRNLKFWVNEKRVGTPNLRKMAGNYGAPSAVNVATS